MAASNDALEKVCTSQLLQVPDLGSGLKIPALNGGIEAGMTDEPDADYLSPVPPPRTKRDIALSLVKITASAVPGFGGPAAEVLETLFRPTLDARRDEWLKGLAEALFRLQDKVAGFDLEQLSHDDSFMTTFVTASQAAMRTHQHDKREALRNAVLNAALGREANEDMPALWLSLVDRFTEWHIRLLHLLSDPKRAAGEAGFSYSGSIGGISHLIEGVFPKLKGRRELYDLLGNDLSAAGLIGIISFHTTMTAGGIFEKRTTEMGDRFLDFITQPADLD
jgi:hypothetical protein